jgi:hypothetical protein
MQSVIHVVSNLIVRSCISDVCCHLVTISRNTSEGVQGYACSNNWQDRTLLHGYCNLPLQVKYHIRWKSWNIWDYSQKLRLWLESGRDRKRIFRCWLSPSCPWAWSSYTCLSTNIWYCSYWQKVLLALAFKQWTHRQTFPWKTNSSKDNLRSQTLACNTLQNHHWK